MGFCVVIGVLGARKSGKRWINCALFAHDFVVFGLFCVFLLTWVAYYV